MPLIPDKIEQINGVTVKTYLLTQHNPNRISIPTVSLPETPLGVTIHNTGAINVASNTTPAEQYTRATINGNMNTVRVHFYVDDTCAWQNLPLTLSGWHAADGSGNGNRKTIAFEVIGNSAKAEANAIKLAAYFLKKYGKTVDNGLFTHTHWLNVRDGKKGTIDYLNTVKNSYKMCLPVDSTELLTPNGWKSLKDITTEDEVAQYENGIISFVHPQAIVEPYIEKTLKTRYLEATSNHRMLVKSYNTKKDIYEDKLWGEILSKTTNYKMNTFGFLNGALNISDDELLLLAWIQGDGHYIKNANGDIIGLEFHLKKERKIKRICQILNELEIKYHQSWCQNGSVHIRIYDKKLYDWAESWLENKEFSYKLLFMSQEQFNLFIDEVKIIDGYKSNRQEMYFSSSIKNLDFIQALCATHGIRTSQCTLGSSKKRYGEQPFCVNFLKTGASFNKNDNIIERETLVSCVTVPSSYILIRQNNHTFIVGNCPIYILPHWSTFKANVKAELDRLNGGAVPASTKTDSAAQTVLYRIRKSWTDVKSQLGAYNSLDNAKKAWKEGYFIYDSNGKQIYPETSSTSTVSTPMTTASDIDVVYRVFSKKKWWPEVKNTTDYAGVKGAAISGIAMKASKGQLRYRVHQKGSNWMGWITGYNINDVIKGMAGIPNLAIDGVQIQFSGIDGYDVKYRVSTSGADYYPWIYGKNTTDFAGCIGKNIDRLQIEIVKK